MERANVQGPIESHEWPAKLAAHVVEPCASPRIHGFDVQQDLARHYTPTDIAFLALTSDLPVDAETSRALEVALAFLAPTSVAEPPAHAASLAQICGARPAGVVSIAAVTLAEQARVLYDEHAAIIPRLLVGSLNGAAASVAARDGEERAAVERLRDALGTFARRVPALGYDLRLDTAIVAVLLACGLRTREQLEVIVTVARLPAACAEAFAWKQGDLRAYPLDLPHFEYEG
jgi:hypothetical protein